MKSILLVEDEHDISEIIYEYLSSKKYRVTKCYDGLEGYVEFMQNEYDLVISDILMDNMQGTELVSLIRANSKDVPIIVISALQTKYEKELVLKAGANKFVSKPFSIKQISDSVEELLGE